MDASMVAAAAAKLLATKFGEGFAGEVGKSAWGGVRNLFLFVRSKLADDSNATAAFDALQTGPSDLSRIRAVAEALQGHAEHDDTFRVELEALVIAADQTRPAAKTMTHISGNARVGKVATIGDVQGDVSF